ncbi:MAG: DUF1657 domain-containing protein [Epulopiscium sp.]|nr:DUF1657 domain-containing protein [Candidatus Epulonipiscium sp.]
MTVKSDLQQAIAACESAKGSYAMMAQATEDKQIKQMYEQMTSDVERHLQYLDGRLNYLNENNTLNQQTES